VVIVVGEASGDLHAAKLVRAMKEADPSLFFCGIGGSAMRKVGVRILMEAADVTAVGVTESLAKLPVILKGMALVRKLIQSLKPDLLILVDFPDFNLRVAPVARKLGVPVLYYIGPQVWAWRQGRAVRIKDLVDRLAVILPFEATFYEKFGVPVTFVGHPLLDDDGGGVEIPDASGTDRDQGIGLLPGSRDREVERHLPLMIEAAGILKSRHPELRFIVSAAPTVGPAKIKAILQRCGSAVSFEVSEAPAGEFFQRVAVVMATSGTVTLEAALWGIPGVILYRVSPLSFWLGKALIRVRYIGLANLIAEKEILPELIQKDASPAALAALCDRMITDSDYRNAIRKACLQVRTLLGGPGASRRTAEIALTLMAGGRPAQREIGAGSEN